MCHYLGLNTRPPVLNHRDVLLNRSLSQLSPQENHLEYHLKPDSTESTRQDTTCHNNSIQSLTHTRHLGTFTPHMGTHPLISIQRGTTHPSHGHPHPTQGHTSFHLSLERNDTPISWASSSHTGAHIVSSQSREERHTHHMGTPNTWALSQVDSTQSQRRICPRGCLTEQ
jgi:hypothetical protein